MPASPSTLEAELLALYTTAESTEMPKETFAEKMAEAIDNFIRTFTANTIVIGTLPTGPVAATGSGGLS